MKILIVDDEPDLAQGIANGLKQSGYITEVCNDGAEGLELIRLNSYDLIILDLNLPEIDGFEILKTIRSEGNETAVLILSARNNVNDKIEGLDLGANDYLTKPFHFGELSARVRSLLRAAFLKNSNILCFGSLQMDTQRHIVTVADSTLALTPREYAILEYLLMNKGIPISTETLIEHTADSEDAYFSNSVKVHISLLRKKLTTADSRLTITNIRGAGYTLEEVKNEE
ncbi:MAG: response regulator transcription factor [Angelakisella sp.]